MDSDHEAEIRASVDAHRHLGPGYEDELAEGLVERIGAEIDKRVEAQLKRYGSVSADQPPPGAPVPGAPPPGYQWYQGYQVPMPPPGYQMPGYQMPGYQPPGYQMAGYQMPGYQVPPPVPAPGSRPPAAQRSVAMTVIALGSMALGVAGTAIVAHAWNGGGGGQAVMVLLIWAVIAIVNVVYARRC